MYYGNNIHNLNSYNILLCTPISYIKNVNNLKNEIKIIDFNNIILIHPLFEITKK